MVDYNEGVMDDDNVKRGFGIPYATQRITQRQHTIGRKALVAMFRPSYEVAPGIIGADGIVRFRIDDITLYDMFAPQWRETLLPKAIETSVAKARRKRLSVAELAAFYGANESAEISPFDA